MDLESEIRQVLRTPASSAVGGPTYGFDALEESGSTKLGISEQVFADMARAALTRSIPGVVFNDITAHRDGNGQLIKIEVDYMDAVHNPSSQHVEVIYR